ncbi:MAG: hypothetical protein R3B96_21230 [Pirellulaceae bacterium]
MPCSSRRSQRQPCRYDSSRTDPLRRRTGKRDGDATTDLIDDFLAGNPNSQEDGSPVCRRRRTYLPLADSVRDLDSWSEWFQKVWRQGELPSIQATSGPNPVPVWTTWPGAPCSCIRRVTDRSPALDRPRDFSAR